MPSVRRTAGSLLVLLAAATLFSGCLFGLGGGNRTPGKLEGTVTAFVGDRTGVIAQPLRRVTMTFGAKSVTTDARGWYSLSGIAEGPGTLVASRADGYPPQEFSVTVGRSGTRCDIALKNLHQLYAYQTGQAPFTAAQATGESRLVVGSTQCGLCHSRTAPLGAFRLENDTNALCSNPTCHTASPTGFIHPALHLDPARVGPPPGRYSGYPNLSCLVCHRPHKDSDQWMAQGLLASARMSLANSCVQCHATLPPNHPSTGGSPCTQCHDTDGNARGHATCSGYSGKYGTPCHRSSSTVATGKHADPTKLSNGCNSCHDVAGTANEKLLRRPNDAGLCYQSGCHPSLSQPDLTVAGHRKCAALCHDPHRAEIGMVTNPTDPNGPLLSVTHQTYRSVSMLGNAYCTTCHRATPPAGYETAKDPDTGTLFTNAQAKPDRVLHRVHVAKVRPDQPPYASRSYDHPEYPYRGDVNKTWCVMCHSVHPTTQALDLLPSVFISRTRGSSGYNGKAGCSLSGSCHTCSYCHGADGATTQNGPGGPGVDCRCYHGTGGDHGIVY